MYNIIKIYVEDGGGKDESRCEFSTGARNIGGTFEPLIPGCGACGVGVR